MGDFVHVGAFLFGGIGVVEDTDPFADFLQRFVGGGGGDQQLQAVDGAEPDRAGVFRRRAGVQQDDRQPDDGEHFGEFLSDPRRLDVAAIDHQAGPLGAAGLVHDFENLLELGDIVGVIGDQDHVLARQFDDGSLFGEKRLELGGGILGVGVEQRIGDDLIGGAETVASADAVLGRHFFGGHEFQHLSVADDSGSGGFQHFVEGFPEFAAGHGGIDVQGDHAFQVGVGGEIESERVGKRGQGVNQRGAVENQHDFDGFVAVDQDQVFIKRRGAARAFRFGLLAVPG